MSLYDQLMNLEGVTEVEILDDCQGVSGAYICGGDNEDIGKILAQNTYCWSSLLGDTEVRVYSYKAYFYRNKQAFRAKFKEMFGQEFDHVVE